MKTDFSVSVQINVGVTPEVVQLVTAILTNRQTAIVAMPTPPSKQPADKVPAPKTKRGTFTIKSVETTAEKEPEAETKTQAEEAPAANEQPKPTPESVEPEELTEQDIREAMHRTRQRIEGEDYKNNTDSEGYKKYHKLLTAQFKNIAALLGSDKPSTLPAAQRASFISQCDELVVENGEITVKIPY